MPTLQDPKLDSVQAKFFSALIRQLEELAAEEESDEYGALRASRHAYEHARALLTDAATDAALDGGRPLPYGCASTDSQGGLRIEWVRPTSSVHLVVPESVDKGAYVYHEQGQTYGTELATPKALSQWLKIIPVE